MRKFLSSHINFYDDTVVDTTPWFFIRLAEVYLNYAECQIELGNNAEALNTSTLSETVRYYRMPQAKTYGLNMNMNAL